MYKLFNFFCINCNDTFEELVEPDEVPSCPTCHVLATAVPYNSPTGQLAQVNPSRQAEITMKGRNIRNKLIGKVPWRRSSESQSS